LNYNAEHKNLFNSQTKQDLVIGILDAFIGRES